MSKVIYRFCPTCKVKWIKTHLGINDCPSCNVDSFFTMNSNDIGANMYLDEVGEKLSDYRVVVK